MSKQRVCLPTIKKPLYDFQLVYYARKYKIPHFRGIFFRNCLPRKLKSYETGIVNMDLQENPGTHWVCYIKRKSNILYFDPLGKISPPLELLYYFAGNTVCYNRKSHQSPGTVNCGHLCLHFLINETRKVGRVRKKR